MLAMVALADARFAYRKYRNPEEVKITGSKKQVDAGRGLAMVAVVSITVNHFKSGGSDTEDDHWL
jgi:hypothetical protein